MSNSSGAAGMRGDYQLVDFGGGRKLESLAGYLVDRPSPAANRVAASAAGPWSAAARYERRPGEPGSWFVAQAAPQPWIAGFDSLRLELRLTEAGQLGVFPEQQDNWRWLAEQIRAAGRPLSVLNLFAYTGASTLAAAAAGARVTHVDAARGAVAWARRNADLSGLDQAPIRWIVEDARRFARREIRRGRRYDAVVLDPPTYGHGSTGQPWRIAEHLEELLGACRELTNGKPGFMLLSCHAPNVGPAEAAALVASTLAPRQRDRIEAGRLALETPGGEKLDAGVMARWPPR